MNKNEIFVIYGNTPGTMVKELLTHIKPENEIDKNYLIGLKPNLVVAKQWDTGATTSPELTAGIIQYLQSRGYKNICILEGSWVGERTPRAFKACGYEELSKQYGVPLIDLQKDGFREYDACGMKINVCDSVMKVDYLINIPVLKGHCQTSMTCALKNMKGCIPDSEKRRFHTLGLHKPIAHLNKVIKQSLIIVDGLMGDLSFEEGGSPVEMNRILAARDPVLVDSYAASLIGFDPSEIQYIRIAEEIGVGSTDLANAVIHELNHDQSTPVQPDQKRFQGFRKYIEERDACSACYGSLVHALERLKEQGKLNKVKTKLYIGQYYKGRCFDGTGIGSCTRCFKRFVPGCPPKARDIVEYLLTE